MAADFLGEATEGPRRSRQGESAQLCTSLTAGTEVLEAGCVPSAFQELRMEGKPKRCEHSRLLCANTLPAFREHLLYMRVCAGF